MKFTIHRQVQAGVIAVSGCVCFLVIFILILNCFMFINTAYNDITEFFELRENQQIKSISLYLDYTLTTMAELNKLEILKLRKFITNNKRNKDFLLNIKVSRKNVFTGDENLEYCLNQNCIYYKMLETDYSNDQDFQYLVKTLGITLPLLKASNNIRYFGLPEKSIWSNTQLLSNKYKTVFFHSINNKFDKNYNITDFNHELTYFLFWLEAAYSYYTKTMNKIDNSLTLRWQIQENPSVLSTQKEDLIKPTYENAFVDNPNLFTTYTPIYKEELNLNSTEMLKNYENLDFLLMGDLPPKVVNEYIIKSVENFKGIQSLVVNDRSFRVLTLSSCEYIRKLYSLYNNVNITKNTPVFVSDCFYSSARSTFQENFISELKSHPYSLYYFKRLIRILFTEDKSDNFKLYLKVMRFASPDNFNNYIVNSSLLTNFKLLIFVIKNTRLMEQMRRQLYLFYLGNMLFIIFFNLFIWVIILISIIFMLKTFSHNISHPITQLVDLVTTIGREDNSPLDKNQTQSKLNSIKFDYDKDIQDLFVMCKVLIKGGFTDDINSYNNKRIQRIKAVNHAYNNISVIKTNNLIIKEDEIKKYIHSSETEVFGYKEWRWEKRDFSVNELIHPEILSDIHSTNKRKSKKSQLINIALDEKYVIGEAYKIIRTEEMKISSSKGILNKILKDLTGGQSCILQSVDLES